MFFDLLNIPWNILISALSILAFFRCTFPLPLGLRLCPERLERGALLTVETEGNRDSKKTNERGPNLVSSLGLSCRYKGFLFCLGCSSRPSTKYFFSPYIFSIPLSPSASKLGRQSLRVYLWFCHLKYRSCADQPYILSWPMVISSSVNEFFVAV